MYFTWYERVNNGVTSWSFTLLALKLELHILQYKTVLTGNATEKSQVGFLGS